MINEDTSKGSRYPSTQKYGGNYELVHPDSETVYAAVYLWHHFGEEPDFRAMLDDLYERTLPLLDAVANFLSPASSLNGLVFHWNSIAEDIAQRRLPVPRTHPIRLLPKVINYDPPPEQIEPGVC